MPLTMPSVFVSHGAPTLAIDPGPTHDFLLGLGHTLGRPRAVLCVSAHWTTNIPGLNTTAQPETIYDFWGFPEEMYEKVYPAPGDAALARQTAELLKAAGIPAGLDPERGLDHGAWVPLLLMYPEADIPVVQLSVQPGRDAAWHLALGQALRPLRNEGVLILGSGGAVHNLRDLHPYAAPPADYAVDFDAWLRQSVEQNRREDIRDYLTAAPQARRAHPTPEHFLPLAVAMGAGQTGRTLHTAFTYGTLSMSAFAWD